MLTGYKEVHPKVVRNLHGTDSTLGRKTGTLFCKPQHWALSPNHIRQVHLLTAHTGKSWNGHAPKDYSNAKTSDSLAQLRSDSHGRQDGAAEFLTETTGTGPKFLFQIGARSCFQGYMNACPHQQMLLFKSGECKRVRQHVIFPLLH